MLRDRSWALSRREQAFFESNGDASDDLRDSWSMEYETLTVRCRRSRYCTEDLDPFKMRFVEFRFFQADQLVSVAALREWALAEPALVDNALFVDAADSLSQTDYEMAEFVASVWDDDDHPLEYGHIVHFDRLSIPRPHPWIWDALSSALTRQFAKRQSLLVVKAFPLEFEGRREDSSGTDNTHHPAFVKRQAAMRRHYMSKLGVRNMSGDGSGWMWRTVRGPEPDVERTRQR